MLDQEERDESKHVKSLRGRDRGRGLRGTSNSRGNERGTGRGSERGGNRGGRRGASLRSRGLTRGSNNFRGTGRGSDRGRRRGGRRGGSLRSRGFTQSSSERNLTATAPDDSEDSSNGLDEEQVFDGFNGKTVFNQKDKETKRRGNDHGRLSESDGQNETEIYDFSTYTDDDFKQAFHEHFKKAAARRGKAAEKTTARKMPDANHRDDTKRPRLEFSKKRTQNR